MSALRLSLLFTLLVGCTDPSELIVDVSTDLVAGVEFDTVSLSLAELDRRASHPVQSAQLGQRFLESPLRVTEEAPDGTYTLTVALERAGAAVLSLRARVTVAGTTGVSVVLTSPCVGVSCDGDAPNCLNGSCVAEGCLTGLEDVCGDFEGCRVDTECPLAAVDCLAPLCLPAGVCAVSETMCATGEYCDTRSGCAAIPTEIADVDAGTDAGVDAAADVDAGVDGALGSDAGTDAGIDAGPTDCLPLVGVTCDVFREAYLKASNTGASDLFGGAVALDGDTIAIGAPQEDSAARGVGGVETDDTLTDAGAVYVFVRSGGSWTQEAYIKAPNSGASDHFGAALAFDGDTLVVGAPNESSAATGVDGDGSDDSAQGSGAVYVFTRTGTNWAQDAYLKASNPDPSDHFGAALALDGDTLAVGAPGESSASTGVGGDPFDDMAGTADSGAVYVFARSGTWSQQAYIKASNTGYADEFGRALALDGNRLAVGAPLEASSATGIDGDGGDDAANGAGTVYVFLNSPEGWAQEAYIKAGNTGVGDNFGSAVALDASTLVVGAPREDSDANGVDGDDRDDSASDAGAVYVFAHSGIAWVPEAYLKASDSATRHLFGSSVAIFGDFVLVGAPNHNGGATDLGDDLGSSSVPGSGAAYLFYRQILSGIFWSEVTRIKASNTGESDSFGEVVAIGVDTFVVGASAERSAATGVGGDETDDSLAGSGAAYVRRFALP